MNIQFLLEIIERLDELHPRWNGVGKYDRDARLAMESLISWHWPALSSALRELVREREAIRAETIRECADMARKLRYFGDRMICGEWNTALNSCADAIAALTAPAAEGKP